NAFKSVLYFLNDHRDPDYTSHDILDSLYPIAFEVEGPQKSFEMLCQANKRGYGWSKYYTDKSYTLARWEFLKAKFPDRVAEFIVNTYAHGSYFDYFSPIS